MEKKWGIWHHRGTAPLCTAFFFFLAHAYRFFNAMYSHDSRRTFKTTTPWGLASAASCSPSTTSTSAGVSATPGSSAFLCWHF